MKTAVKAAMLMALAILLEGLSCVSYVLMFRPVFCRSMPWRTSWEIGLAELGADAQGRDPDRLIDCLELCEDTRRRLERNVLEDLALEALFNRLRRAGAPG